MIKFRYINNNKSEREKITQKTPYYLTKEQKSEEKKEETRGDI